MARIIRFELNLLSRSLTAFVILMLIPSILVQAQEKKKIKLIRADVLEYDESLGHKARRLIGNVQFEHEGTLMDCDSAYLYSTNSLDAFGHVHINKGDSMFTWCDKLFYDGETKKAKALENVKMDDGEMILESNVIHYDLETDIANYYYGGKITSAKDTLTSLVGVYFSNQNNFLFTESVELRNPKYVMNCDSMLFNTESEVSFFFGPTTIVSDENTIYCENGWFDTKKDVSQFNKNAVMYAKNQSIAGDSIFYDRNKGYGIAVCNVTIKDTVEKILIEGDYAEYFTKEDKVIMTERALLKQNMDGDTLYLHADTLYSFEDTTLEKRILFAYHDVQFFKSDMSGRCDSLVYSYVDSTIRMFKDPVLWSEDNQLTADSIWIQMRDSKIDQLFMRHNSLIVSEEDSLMFNQIQGRHMIGQFNEGKLQRVNVRGNGETLYYTGEEGKNPDSVNKSESSDLDIHLDSNKVERIVFLGQPTAKLTPLKNVSISELKLGRFQWLHEYRPLNQWAIFEWKAREVKAKKKRRR
ncbi:MAG: lipopolysaccharide export system protein LptA [Bacteroidia bacterium]|jgi:lipopolysaccharide export system protein LptA